MPTKSKETLRLHNTGFKFSQLMLNWKILFLPDLYLVTDEL